MRDILEEIVANKREEIAQFHQLLPITTLATLTEKMLHITVPSMRRALMESTTGIIAEFKRRSPSRGWIHRDARVSEVVPAYEQSGASAVSILTDRNYFGGYDEHIQQARFMGVSLPILYKNFVVDEYQLFQARYCGASAVLLIASVLTIDECRRLMSLAHQLGLEVLLEMHAESELDYAAHLGTFTTDVDTSFHLAERLTHDACKVSESGISSPDVIARLRESGYRGFLIGETFMREPSPGDALARMVGQLNNLSNNNH